MHDLLTNNQLKNLEPISLSGLDSVKLLNRVDRKYIIPPTKRITAKSWKCWLNLILNGHKMAWAV